MPRPKRTSAKAASNVRPAGGAAVLVLHGPNLNLLGTREPAIYGHDTLRDIDARLEAQARAEGIRLLTFQSNHEDALVDRVQSARNESVRYVLINPAAFTHTSVALRDALAAVAIPYIEIHLSNVHAREPFRHHSYFSDKAVGTVVGLGPLGYELALQFALRQLKAR